MQKKSRFIQVAVLAGAVLVLVGFILYRTQGTAQATPQASTSPQVHMGGSKSMVMLEPTDLSLTGTGTPAAPTAKKPATSAPAPKTP